jgi:polysaccharide export outer membrane protein
MKRQRLGSATLMLVVMILAGPAGADEPGRPGTDPGQSREGAEYRIGPEDVLQISVWKNEALSRTLPVRPDGKITLPLLNDLQAAGYTPMELREVLVQRLADFVSSPEVAVIVVETRSFKVSVIGEIPKPGRYELKSDTTVLDVLALAGGLNQFASRKGIVVLRPNGKTTVRLPFNYNKAISGAVEQENFSLRPGDVIVVP